MYAKVTSKKPRQCEVISMLDIRRLFFLVFFLFFFFHKIYRLARKQFFLGLFKIFHILLHNVYFRVSCISRSMSDFHDSALPSVY